MKLHLAIAGCCAVAMMAANSSDKITALPLHPGLTFQQEVDSPVCGKKSRINIYDTPDPARMPEYIAWYKAQLRGFHYVHQMWSDRAQEMFYSPDGSTNVTITGVPRGDGVFAVSYISVSGGLTTHQMDAFGPSNPSCK